MGIGPIESVIPSTVDGWTIGAFEYDGVGVE